MQEKFRKLSQFVSTWCGSPGAFALALASIAIWGLLGPIFHYSDTWQLVINTATTIITFLMVFLIQNTQNRDVRILQLKIDELLRTSKTARNKLIHLEDLADAELDRLHEEFSSLHEEAAATIRNITAARKKRRPSR